MPPQWARHERLAELAKVCLERERPDERDGLRDWSDKAAPASLVKTLFEVQANYTEAPMELLELWSEDIIPEMVESEDGKCAAPRPSL